MPPAGIFEAKRNNLFLTIPRHFDDVVQAGTPMAMPEEAPFCPW